MTFAILSIPADYLQEAYSKNAGQTNLVRSRHMQTLDNGHGQNQNRHISDDVEDACHNVR